MNVVERYVPAEVGPRACEDADPGNPTERHHAEVTLHEGKRERFLCKSHAAYALASNLSLLAKAVVELSLAE